MQPVIKILPIILMACVIIKTLASYMTTYQLFALLY